MKRQLMQIFALLLTSLLTVSVIYFKIPSIVLQQSIAVFVVVLLIANRFVFSRSKSIPFVITTALIALVSIFLQLLVISSGGFYSPFLILFHLFAIALSFLFAVKIAIGFLSFSIMALIAGTLLDPRLHSLFVNDPFSAALYLLSFAVIIPLYQLVSSRYHLEEAISKILSIQLKQKGAQLELTQKRDESLLGGLSDLVIVIDLNLKILSVNEATIRTLKLSSAEALGQSVFNVLYLKDMKGEGVDRNFLSIDEIIERGTTHFFDNLLLYTKNTPLPRKINLRIYPTKNLAGQIDQIVFIISNAYSGGHLNVAYQNIEQAALRHESLLEAIKNELEEKDLKVLKGKIELLGKTEEDILTATEIISFGIKPNFTLLDAANLMQRVVDNEKDFARSLGIPLNFSLSKEFREKFITLDSQDNQPIPQAFTSQYFTALSELRWIDILLKKILDLLILLSVKEKQPRVEASISFDEKAVRIDVSCIYLQPVPKDFEKLLLTEYYGNLGNVEITLGSGLEGYLIKTIAALLNLSFNIVYNEKSSALYFTVRLPKGPV